MNSHGTTAVTKADLRDVGQRARRRVATSHPSCGDFPLRVATAEALGSASISPLTSRSRLEFLKHSSTSSEHRCLNSLHFREEQNDRVSRLLHFVRMNRRSWGTS